MKSANLVANNQLTLLQSGAEYFPLLCADIAAAQHAVFLETYIFAADATGRAVLMCLQQAALRGVSVHLLLDGFGSADFPATWLRELQTAGVRVLWFRRDISPFTFKRNRMRRLRRLHRKLAVIDQRVAYVGGINIIDDGQTAGEIHAPRFDYAVRIQGEMAQTVQVAMAHLWSVVSWATLRQREPKLAKFAVPQPSAGSPDLRLILRDNFRHRRDIERAYLYAISHARHEVMIANAYFLPGRVFLRALLRAAQRGVKVVLLLQGKVEYRLQHYATRALYEQLLAAGIQIYEYQASYLHAKVAVVDSHWATVGSSNIDPLSLLLAREANLLVRDSKFAGELRSSLLAAVAQGGKLIVRQEIQPVFSHLLARASYALVRFLVGMLGYGRR